MLFLADVDAQAVFNGDYTTNRKNNHIVRNIDTAQSQSSASCFQRGFLLFAAGMVTAAGFNHIGHRAHHGDDDRQILQIGEKAL